MTSTKNEGGCVGTVDWVAFRGGQVVTVTGESSKLLGGVCLMELLTEMGMPSLFYLSVVFVWWFL